RAVRNPPPERASPSFLGAPGWGGFTRVTNAVPGSLVSDGRTESLSAITPRLQPPPIKRHPRCRMRGSFDLPLTHQRQAFLETASGSGVFLADIERTPLLLPCA